MTVIWESGVTENKSSGAPLFDENRKVVGNLEGGGSSCATPRSPDYFGRLAKSWNSSDNQGVSLPSSRLKEWLDPDNTNVMSLNGIFMPILKYGYSFSSGDNEEWNAYDEIKIGSNSSIGFNVQSGAELKIKSGRDIVIRPCTIINTGANFKASIKQIDCSEQVLEYSDTEASYNANNCAGSASVSEKFLSEVAPDITYQNVLKVQPNPITEISQIAIWLMERTDAKIEIYNILGNKISVIAEFASFDAGYHTFVLDATNYLPGFYYVVLTTANEVKTYPISIIK